RTIDSVLSQTLRPVRWVVVDDGSTDASADIVRELGREHSWITLLTPTEVRPAEIGARIAFLINRAVESIDEKHEYLLKLDADVEFAPDFCSGILNEFERDPRLGIASGHLREHGIPERIQFQDHTRGATKFFRRTCWDDMGGLFLTTGWDTVCDIAARSKGWKTSTLEYYFDHLKTEGTRKGGHVLQHYWDGVYCGRVPYHPLYFTLRVVSHVLQKPVVLGSIAELWGYFRTRFVRRERPFSSELTAFYRKVQMQRIAQIMRG
ncbi:MAG TPA: glycosyltransferase family A protein, partial [Bacteroidota bacterium]|nr:glycosyltransferase family A protein [Bacteroidota bacterium]